jgi:serine/threonine protein kinase
MTSLYQEPATPKAPSGDGTRRQYTRFENHAQNDKTGFVWQGAEMMHPQTLEKVEVLIRHFVRDTNWSDSEYQFHLHNALTEIQTYVHFSKESDFFAQVLDFSMRENDPYVTFYRYQGSSLYEAIRNQAAGQEVIPLFSRQGLKILVERVGKALWLMHAKKIYHQDIKPGNILLDASGLDSAVLSDFDLISTIHSFAVGTLRYLSPTAIEAYQGSEVASRWYDLKQRDVYAFAQTIYEIFSLGESPYGEDHLIKTTMSQRLQPRDLPTFMNELKVFMKTREYISLTKFPNPAFDQSQLRRADQVMQRALEMPRTKPYEDVTAFTSDLLKILR